MRRTNNHTGCPKTFFKWPFLTPSIELILGAHRIVIAGIMMLFVAVGRNVNMTLEKNMNIELEKNMNMTLKKKMNMTLEENIKMIHQNQMTIFTKIFPVFEKE